MKRLLYLAAMFCSATCYGQQMTYEDWEQESTTNIRLLPKYGYRKKTEMQKQMDLEFISSTMQSEKFNGNRTAASNHMVGLGFQYLYKGDIKTAMYRFNQAYLLDSLNTDIYWGFGGVYMTLGDLEKAKQQYMEGLSLKPDNTHLLTDYGTYFMVEYLSMSNMPANEYVKNPKREAEILLDSALLFLNKSYKIDPKDPNTTFKLSTSYFYKGDCDNAWKYYNECTALGGQPITEEYTEELKKTCRKK